jgi:hypothetical protein
MITVNYLLLKFRQIKTGGLLAIDRVIFLSVIIILLVWFNSCKDEPYSTEPVIIPEGAWLKYSPYKWTHDGDPYVSEYCIIYSDGASKELKKQAGQFADAKFADILSMFDFKSEKDFRFPPEHNKIDIYLNLYHEEKIAAAFWGSVIISFGSPRDDISRYEYLFLHELTHAFEFLIEGRPELGTDVWFREGIAIYCGGGRNYIKTVNDLDTWIARNSQYPNLGNPITIHQWENFPDGSDIPGYYMVFDVVMKYILDVNGMNKSCQDVLELFYDVRNGAAFGNTFRANFQISLDDFESEIFDRLRIYLASDQMQAHQTNPILLVNSE